MKLLKFFPILFLFVFSGCNSDKDLIQPDKSDVIANSQTAERLGICDVPSSIDHSQIAPELSLYLNCITPICENATTLPINHVFYIYTVAPPYTYTDADLYNFANQSQTEAKNFLPYAQAQCPSAIISSYNTLMQRVYINGVPTYRIRVVVWYSCCSTGGGGGID